MNGRIPETIRRRAHVLYGKAYAWQRSEAVAKPRRVAFPGHADSSPACGVPNSRCFKSRDSCSSPSALGPAAFEPRSNAPFRWADRVLLVWLSQLWNAWRSALLIVKRRPSSPGIARGVGSIGGGRVGAAQAVQP